MIVLAMLMAAATYPAFDPKGVEISCRVTNERVRKAYPESPVIDLATCVKYRQIDYRRFLVIAQNVDEPTRRAVVNCVQVWSKDGGPDWNMIRFCAVDILDGERDFPSLRKNAPAEVRPAIQKCLRADTKDGAIDWGGVASCARDQINGQRDFNLLLAAATKDDHVKIERCRAYARDDDKIIDWDSAVNCAADGGRDGSDPPGAAITVT